MSTNQQNSTESTPQKTNLLMTAITTQQAEVINALVHGATVTEAAKKVNINRSTFYIWLKNADFVAELNRIKQEQNDAMHAQLRGLAKTAVSTLREMLTGKDVPAGVKLKAALAVLQGVGTLEPELIGQTDPREVQCNLMLEFLFLASQMQRLGIDEP
jgi:Helix-turn-helix of insertion element transposase